MLQYKIPQNVGIEDKIVGPFSLRQLIILAVGGGISYVIFAISSRIYELNILEYIIIAIPALLAIAIAMVKIHNVTFGKYILLLLEFAIKPKKRLWDHRGISALVIPDLRDKTAAKKAEAAGKQAEEARKNVNLSDLSAMLDSGGFENVQPIAHEDIDESSDEDLITEAYFGHKRDKSTTENMYWRTRDMQKKKLEILAKMPKPGTAASASPAAAILPEQPQSQPAHAGPQVKEPTSQNAGPPQEEKKESVAEHLAKVIQEAKDNNQKKLDAEPAKSAPATPAPTAPAAPATPAQAETAAQAVSPAQQPASASQKEVPEKKKRKRKKKPKTAAPVRKDAKIDTSDKKQPGVQPQPSREKQPAPSPEKEVGLSDLKDGKEIEFNLD